MFEVGDKVWYCSDYAGHGPYVPAVVTSIVSAQGPFASLHCRKDGAQFTSWGYLYQFESRACHLCDAATAEPGCPLCPDCSEEQEAQERDAKAEKEECRALECYE